jgi:hypothetical protein
MLTTSCYIMLNSILETLGVIVDPCLGYQVEVALDKAYPGAVLPNKGLVCSTTASGNAALSEVMPCRIR